jgi:hypothetical protein
MERFVQGLSVLLFIEKGDHCSSEMAQSNQKRVEAIPISCPERQISGVVSIHCASSMELGRQRPITGAEPKLPKRLNARNQTNHKDRASTRNITKLATQLANVVNRQPDSIQCVYDLDVVNYQDVDISMIRRVRSFHSSSRIGIGGSLAASLLPHHLAYGSRTKAVRLITSALLPTGSSVSSVHHEHHSFEQLRFRQLYPHWAKGLLTTSTVRAFSLPVSGSAYLFPPPFGFWSASLASPASKPTMPSADSCTAVRIDCSTLSPSGMT